MANVKITDLGAYTDPASTDVLPIVDVGADVTKKVSIADLLKNASAGTAAAPGIAFDGDNTGIYSPGADQIAISTNGTGRLFVDPSGNVAIGGAGPVNELDVNGAIGVVYDKGLRLYKDIGTVNNAILQHTFSGGDVLEIAPAGNSAASFIAFRTADASSLAERVRIDSSGRLLVGTSSALTDRKIFVNRPSTLGILQSSGQSGLVIITNQTSAADSVGGRISLQRFVGADTAVSNDDELGSIVFGGSTGSGATTDRNAAQIKAEVDGTPGSEDMPGRLVFSVTADGSALPAEAMRIKNTRVINFSNTPVYADNAAAKTGGLVNGDVYRTSTGDLKIVYT